jgi:hypothetical protein
MIMTHNAPNYDCGNCIECEKQGNIVKATKNIFIGDISISICLRHSSSISTLTRNSWNDLMSRCRKCSAYHPNDIPCDNISISIKNN